MKKTHIWILLVLVLAILAGCLLYQQRFAPMGENRYERTIESIDLSGSPVQDLTQLKAFSNLKKIDLRGTGLQCEEYEQVKTWFPEAQILWDIPFQGEYFPMDTRELTITTLSEADLEALSYFAELKTIRAEECPDYPVLDALRRQRPDLEMHYRIPVAGETFGHQAVRLRLPGECVEELFDLLPMFPELWSVELEAPLAPADRILALQEAFPDIIFSWHLDLGGVSVNKFTETLDLTGIPMTVEEMDAVLPYLPNLTFVDMTDCGISNEEMDALNRRHEDVKIVWTVNLGKHFRLRTDATYFMPVKEKIYATDEIVYNLRYCTDMIAIDLGHMGVSNIDFVAYMPHLKYLLLCETGVTDLTPLTGLEELVYLELFLTPVRDLSPLLTLKSLEDLNLSYTQGDVSVVAQMTWLKNLWWCSREEAIPTKSQQQMLREALPDCNFNFVKQSSTGGGWRELPNYYAQRDIFGMYYMTG